MEIFIFLVCFAASLVGGICGIGGGVIIKPLLDATGIMSVTVISFLSGLTVLSMSAVSVFRNRKESLVELTTCLLAVGAVAGGLLGKLLFTAVKAMAGNDRFVGMIQSIVMGSIELFTLFYTLRLKDRMRSYHVRSKLASLCIGLVLGISSAFLGIGGGALNITVLYLFFSMTSKKAAANSLYIILFSQISSLLTTVIKGEVPEFRVSYLVFMIAAGILGGLIASKISKKISEKSIEKLFSGTLVVIIGICINNAIRFAVG